MADDTGKVFSESEHLAILADRVAQETATLTTSNAELQAALTEAQNKLDASDSAKVAAEQARQTAETELADYKTEVTEREAAAERKDVRVAEVKEKAKHLTDEWFTEERVARIVAKSDEDFTAYVDDLVSSVPAGEESREVPRETALLGARIAGDDKTKVSAARGFLLRGYEAPQKQEA
jgi:chromosome segregation ATPase